MTLFKISFEVIILNPHLQLDKKEAAETAAGVSAARKSHRLASKEAPAPAPAVLAVDSSSSPNEDEIEDEELEEEGEEEDEEVEEIANSSKRGNRFIAYKEDKRDFADTLVTFNKWDDVVPKTDEQWKSVPSSTFGEQVYSKGPMKQYYVYEPVGRATDEFRKFLQPIPLLEPIKEWVPGVRRVTNQMVSVYSLYFS